MTSVIGHMTGIDFAQQYRKWHSCAPGQLFDAEVITKVPEVGMIVDFPRELCQLHRRTRKPSRRILRNRRDMRKPCSSGRTVIVKGSILALKFVRLLGRGTRGFKSNELGSAIQRERRPMLNQMIGECHVDTQTSHVIHAAQNAVDLDDRQANAVSARIELDLRLGAAFTRYQTLTLQTLGGSLEDKLISYGESRPALRL